MPPDAVERWLTLVGLAAAALAGLLYLGRMTWRGFQKLERIADLVTHELNPNTGSSMKDDVAAIARAVGELQGIGDRLTTEVAQLSREKETAHELLQLQLDTIRHDLEHHPATHKREGRHELQSDPKGPGAVPA